MVPVPHGAFHQPSASQPAPTLAPAPPFVYAPFGPDTSLLTTPSAASPASPPPPPPPPQFMPPCMQPAPCPIEANDGVASALNGAEFALRPFSRPPQLARRAPQLAAKAPPPSSSPVIARPALSAERDPDVIPWSGKRVKKPAGTVTKWNDWVAITESEMEDEAARKAARKEPGSVRWNKPVFF